MGPTRVCGLIKRSGAAAVELSDKVEAERTKLVVRPCVYQSSAMRWRSGQSGRVASCRNVVRPLPTVQSRWLVRANIERSGRTVRGQSLSCQYTGSPGTQRWLRCPT